jgi:hypothetical protein
VTRPADFDALVLFAMAAYEASAERAETIVTNHADAVRAEMEKAKHAEKETAPKKESGAAQTEKSHTPAE